MSPLFPGRLLLKRLQNNRADSQNAPQDRAAANAIDPGIISSGSSHPSRVEMHQTGSTLERITSRTITSNEAGTVSTLSATRQPASVKRQAVIGQNGEIDCPQLSRFVHTLIEHIPSLPPDASASLHQRRDRIVSQLRQVRMLAEESQSLNAEQMLQVRDGFAAAAKDARKLTKNFLGRRFPRHRDPALALSYSCLASVFVELKRIHLTAAAPQIVHDFVQRELTNLKEQVPTLDRMSSSMLSTDTGITVSRQMELVGIDISGSKNRTFWFDDDRDVNFWNGYGVAVKLGAPSTWVINAALKFGMEAGSVYFETEKMTDMLALVLNQDANRSRLKSARPHARHANSRLQQVHNALRTKFSGQGYAQEAGAPLYLNDRKLAKGFSTTKLHVLGEALDRISGEGVFSVLLKDAYPAPADRLRGATAGDIFQEPLARTVPVSDPLGRSIAPFRNYSASMSAGQGKDLQLASGLKAGAEASVTGSWNTAQFHLRNVEPSHRLLDPDYHADMANTFQLFTQLDALLEARAPSKLYAYGRVLEALGCDSSAELSDVDHHYYGPVEHIPRQFRDSITTTDLVSLGERLETIQRICDQLHAAYIDFTDCASALASEPDKFLPKDVLAELNAVRTAAFDEINQDLWGATRESEQTGYPGGGDAALRDPQQFIAQTHDAIGIALGCAGAHLAVVKRRIVQLMQGSTDANDIDQKRSMILDADDSYTRTKTLLDKSYLPMNKTDVFLKQGTFEDRGLSQRHNFIARVSANGGLRFNLRETVASTLGKTTGDYDITNESGQAILTVQCRYQYADYQINPSRQGNFLEFRINAQAGNPVAGAVIVAAVMHALKKLHPEVDEVRQRQSLAEQLQGLVWDSVSGASAVLRLRRFPQAHQGFDLQFVRMLEAKTSGPKVSVPVPTPVGTFTTQWSQQNTLQNVVSEVLGPDIGYLMLQHAKLHNVMATASANAARLAHLGVDESVLLTSMLKGGIDTDSALSQHFEGDADARWVARSYFGTRALITTVIDKYLAYAKTAEHAQSTGTSLADAPADNEFFRYYQRNSRSEPFHRVASVAREAKHYSPGSTVRMLDKKSELRGTPGDPFAIPESLLAIIPMPTLPGGVSWEEEKAYIESLPTDDARIDYFCSARGRPVLDMFVTIIETTKQVHNISRHRVDETRYGFQTRLIDRDERMHASQPELPGASLDK